MVQLGMCMLKLLPCDVVDKMVQSLAKLKYGDFSHYGLQTPSKGPFYLKRTTGRSPVIDVGTMHKIKTRDIQVLYILTYLLVPAPLIKVLIFQELRWCST